MAFNWKALVLAIVIFAALTTLGGGYGKWIFALVMLGILLTVGVEKILPSTK